MKKIFCFLLTGCTLLGLEENFDYSLSTSYFPYYFFSTPQTIGLPCLGLGFRTKAQQHGFDLSGGYTYSSYSYRKADLNYLYYFSAENPNSYYLGLGGGVRMFKLRAFFKEYYPSILFGRQFQKEKNKQNFYQLQFSFTPSQDYLKDARKKYPDILGRKAPTKGYYSFDFMYAWGF